MRFMIEDDTEDYRGFTIRVKSDFDSENPRNFCNLGTIWTFERNYISPDAPPRDDPWEALVDLYTEASPRADAYQHLARVFCPEDARGDWDVDIGTVAYAMRKSADKAFAKLAEVAIILPVYVYDHSGRTYSTSPFSCPWDSGQVGWTFITLKDVRKEYGKRITKDVRDKAISLLQIELQTYDQWASGEVYGYIIEDKDGEHIDSCWGFYGMDVEESGLWEMATNAIDCEVESRRKVKQAKVKTMIRNHVPLEKRI